MHLPLMQRSLLVILISCLILPAGAGDETAASKDASQQTPGDSEPVNPAKGNAVSEPSAAGKTISGKSTGGTSTSGKTAAGKSATGKTAAGKANASKPLVVTPGREAAAKAFVQLHHPELSELLIQLKESSTKEYERAIRDLFRTSERLAQIQERDPAAYELELKLWKVRSRAQLISAKLQMADSEDLRNDLWSTLEEEYELQMQSLARERDRLEERLKGLNAQIDRLGQRRKESITNQFKKLTQSSARADVKAKTNVKTKVVPTESVK